MPKLNQAQTKTYGTEPVDNSLTFRQRLMERFQPHEYVRVINCDSEPVRWQYLPSNKETYNISPDPIKETIRGDVEVYLLNPGESEVLLGENAYIMIEVLFKQIVSKKVVAKSPDLPAGVARSFNFTDPEKQVEWINKILIGRETPQFGAFELPEDEEEKETYGEPTVKSRA